MTKGFVPEFTGDTPEMKVSRDLTIALFAAIKLRNAAIDAKDQAGVDQHRATMRAVIAEKHAFAESKRRSEIARRGAATRRANKAKQVGA